jgi:type VI secretion system protein ImpG
MDPGLLRLYNEELAHLREVGAEFARQFPKIASRLSMNSVEVSDPYVERLLEGFAFLAARVQLKIDAEHPRFIAHLLETVYPGFLSAVPSMVIVRMQPDLSDPNLGKGASVPRASALVSDLARGQNTRCEFRTAHEVRLWPMEITQAQYFSYAADLPMAQLPLAGQVRGGLRIRLRTHGGVRFDQLPMEELALHLSAPDDVAWRLHELIGSATLGSWVLPAGAVPASAVPARAQWRDAASVRPTGFDDEQALMPETLRGFSGHRLLQELAALPHRFLFFNVDDLAARLARVANTEAELVLLFSRGEAALESLVDAGSLALFCTPAINLFPKRLDRIQTSAGQWEYHAVPDRTRPIDFEVHGVESVTGYGTGAVAEQTFLPLYTTFHTDHPDHAAYYTVRREQRLLSQRQQQQGPRSSYIGTELYLSLVDPRNAPYREDIRQLSVSAWVTNRDLPTLLPGGGSTDLNPNAGAWTLESPGPVKSVQCLRGPTRPVQRAHQGREGWALINHLTLNHLSIAGESPAKAAAALRSLLTLYGPPNDAGWRKQVDGVQAVRARQVTRRLPFPGPLTFGAGVQVEVDVDELSFQGASAFLLGSVLEQLFARQAAINSFSETVLRSASRGVLMRWPARVGQSPMV